MAYGALPQVPTGTVFVSRPELQKSGSHRDREGGIIGHVDQLGAESIVLNQPGHGYGDDSDFGELVFYTGHGGRDRRSGRQIADQEFIGRNRTLTRNVDTGQPVRLHRQLPGGGFRYDGLYSVEEAWRSPGRDGYAVCRFRLHRLPDDEPARGAGARSSPRRTTSTVSRLARDGDVPQKVKTWHDYTCQVCGTRLQTITGPYAEGAHILPLGGGYDGPDSTSNLLCLCPNCHVQLDHGGLFVADDLRIVDSAGLQLGVLRTHPDHWIDLECVRSHRQLFRR